MPRTLQIVEFISSTDQAKKEQYGFLEVERTNEKILLSDQPEAVVPVTARRKKKKNLIYRYGMDQKPGEEMFLQKKNHKNVTALKSGVDISI